MSAIKEPQFCIVMRKARDSSTLGVVVKETLFAGQARLLAERCGNADKDASFWVLHHNECINLIRDKFYVIPEATL